VTYEYNLNDHLILANLSTASLPGRELEFVCAGTHGKNLDKAHAKNVGIGSKMD
jgi:hypothetical protein